MARKLFILAIFLMAGSIGVLGYQVGAYLIEGGWPAVSLQFIWVTLFGPIPNTQWMSLGRVWGWFGAVPVTVAGVVAAYALFLISDTLRQR